MTSPPVVLRPRKTRRVCWAAAAVIVVAFSGLATLLTGSTGDKNGATFQRSDQYAMVVLGLLLAAGILVFTRPRVIADERRIRVRNLIGGYDLPWEIVRAVRFDRGRPWASLELEDDDLITLLAVQATDKEYAVAGVRALRVLLTEHRARLAADAP
jgi:hypothetical protein